MKSSVKSKIIILIALVILFALSPMITVNLSFIAGNNNKSSEYSAENNLDKENLKISAISGKIHIDLSVDSKFIIETKKIPSETYRQFLISPVSEDIRITGNHYGIAFGIDTSATKELLRYNRLSYLP